MTMLKKAAAILAMTIVTIVTIGAAGARGQATVTGAWTMTIESGGSHQDMKATLELVQKGAAISGTFTSPHSGNRPVEGEFKDGKLSFGLTTPDGQQRIGFSATLRDDDTLAGYMSTPSGDMKWTATRVKAAK